MEQFQQEPNHKPACDYLYGTICSHHINGICIVISTCYLYTMVFNSNICTVRSTKVSFSYMMKMEKWYALTISFRLFHPSLRLEYHWENSKICKKNAIFWFYADTLQFWIASRSLVKDECVATLVRDIIVKVNYRQSCYGEEGQG